MMKNKKKNNILYDIKKLKNKSLILLVILLSFSISSCSSIPIFKTKTIIQNPQIIHPAPPPQPNIIDFKIIVVNRTELKKLLKNNKNDFSYFMITPEGYEIIIKNFNDLR